MKKNHDSTIEREAKKILQAYERAYNIMIRATGYIIQSNDKLEEFLENALKEKDINVIKDELIELVKMLRERSNQYDEQVHIMFREHKKLEKELKIKEILSEDELWKNN